MIIIKSGWPNKRTPLVNILNVHSYAQMKVTNVRGAIKSLLERFYDHSSEQTWYLWKNVYCSTYSTEGRKGGKKR